MDEILEIFESAGSCLIAAAIGLVVIALVLCCVGGLFIFVI